MPAIDLNCDMGELPGALAAQEDLMRFVTSVNVACGGHAGDEAMMAATVEQALRHGVAAGAHPGYPDRANFGRISMELPDAALKDSIYEQVSAFARVAQSHGVAVAHVKPHGALYNEAARNAALARVIAEGVARWSRSVILVGLAGSVMLDVFRDAGFRVAAEAFADRRYEPDGSLRSRKLPGALIEDPEAAARQAVEIARRGAAQTICIHSDTPGATAIAAAARRALEAEGFRVVSLGR